MSWSIDAKGHPSSVKDALVKQFANAKQSCAGNPHELGTIAVVEQLVGLELDYLHEQPAVHAEASGSAWGGDELRSIAATSQVHVKVETIHGFLQKLENVGKSAAGVAGTAVVEALDNR